MKVVFAVLLLFWLSLWLGCWSGLSPLVLGVICAQFGFLTAVFLWSVWKIWRLS